MRKIGLKFEVNLSNVVCNYENLKKYLGASTSIACVLKNDAYGLGIKRIAHVLYNNGCRKFIVGTIDEARQIIEVAPASEKIILYLDQSYNDFGFLKKNKIVPVVGEMCQLEAWRLAGARYPVYLRLDLGLRMTGLTHCDLRTYQHLPWLKQAPILGIIGHLSNYNEDPTNRNIAEFDKFSKIANLSIPGLRSLASTDSIFLGRQYLFDLVRSGSFVLGLKPTSNGNLEQRPTFEITASALSVQTIKKGNTIGYVGYPNSYVADSDKRILVAGFGYGNGVRWNFNTTVSVCIGEYKAISVGENSMEFTAFDVTHIPEQLLDQCKDVVLIGKHQSVESFAESCRMLPQEVSCLLGNLNQRTYVNDNIGKEGFTDELCYACK